MPPTQPDTDTAYATLHEAAVAAIGAWRQVQSRSYTGSPDWSVLVAAMDGLAAAALDPAPGALTGDDPRPLGAVFAAVLAYAPADQQAALRHRLREALIWWTKRVIEAARV